MLELFVEDLVVDVLTGVYSEETNRPQPLRISVRAELRAVDRYEPASPLRLSKDYMELKRAATSLPQGRHFALIEAVADHIVDAVMAEDERVACVTVRIVKLALAEHNESIGICLSRRRDHSDAANRS